MIVADRPVFVRAPDTAELARMRRGRFAEIGLVSVPPLVLLVAGWQFRWIADDGLIVTRVVRQILAGHGPVFNVGDRAESGTSTAWTFLVAAISWVTRADPAPTAVVTGLLLTCIGLALAIDGSRRMWRCRTSRLLLPAGALVVIALPPFWEFATSGLETGLTFCWTAGLWWLLVCLRGQPAKPFRLALLATFVAGLGPLVRPELTIFTVAVVIGIVLTARPRSWKRILIMVIALGAASVGWEIFRAAYFGILVPLTAVAKNASGSDWARGFRYFLNFVGPYWLIVPTVLVVVLALLATLSRFGGSTRGVDPVLFLVPMLSALALSLYVTKLGGDFMHARMLLPPLFLLLLPVTALPVQKLGAVAVVALAGWCAFCAIGPRPSQSLWARDIPPGGIVDERSFYDRGLDAAHPITQAAFVSKNRVAGLLDEARRLAASTGHGILIFGTPRGKTVFLPLRPGLPWHVVVIWNQLGAAGAAAHLDEAAFDLYGLSYPLAAHAQLIRRGRPGHEKELSKAFVVADLVDPSADLSAFGTAAVAAARQVLACPSMQEFLASVRAPLTLGRAWANLRHSVGRTRLVVPQKPPLPRCP